MNTLERPKDTTSAGVTISIPPGAESPVLWGSVAGVVVAASIAFASFVVSPHQAPGGQAGPAWIVAVFACTVGVRYYTSVVFLTYDDFLSDRIRHTSSAARKAIFISQCALVLGSSLNISLLTTIGALASGIVILAQSLSTIMYWKPLWPELIKGPEGNFRLVMVIGEFAVGTCALYLILRHFGVVSDLQGQSLLVGSVITVFIAECVTTYATSIRAFWKRTASYLTTTDTTTRPA